MFEMHCPYTILIVVVFSDNIQSHSRVPPTHSIPELSVYLLLKGKDDIIFFPVRNDIKHDQQFYKSLQRGKHFFIPIILQTLYVLFLSKILTKYEWSHFDIFRNSWGKNFTKLFLV